MRPMSDSQPIPGTPPDPAQNNAAFQKFCEVVAKLRSLEGCPWDRQQTLETIKPHTLEETYELLEAIDSGNDEHIVEELGDVLLQVVLDAQIGADEGRFNLTQVIERITAKMIHRHPHVFGDAVAENTDDVRRNWEAAKNAEKSDRQSLLDGLPAALPQLARAARITAKAARVGYDFPQREMLFAKLEEELNELAAELFPDGKIPVVPAEVDAEIVPDEPVEDADLKARIEGELGDVLFVLANVARRWGINPEEALRKSNEKFERRFRYIEDRVREQGQQIAEISLIEMEQHYQEGKSQEAP
ncbi:MAG: nucleoside triphosphate pyrophosphohydrolase [Planctomycetaceae bacterium]|nr:nucleoside triphosphate pyrophosphohydrolase [Planctomycetaceae bacterium]